MKRFLESAKAKIPFLSSGGRSQLELPIAREVSQDRNFERGGRSFYFFDFDDNVAFLTTPSYIFHRETQKELILSSGEFAQVHRSIGRTGPYRDYVIDYCDRTGTFRNFRDQELSWLERVVGKKQMFVQDLAAALGRPDLEWKGPSWSCFYHASLNQRPVSVITARGHHPVTIREAIGLFVKEKHLPQEPNFLSIFPVSNKAVRLHLGDSDGSASVAELKKRAIRASVELAIERYGYNPHHRFGMSDDDPHNIELIFSAMKDLKGDYPEMSFFVIETQGGRFVKWEVFNDRQEATLCTSDLGAKAFEQMTLFSGSSS